jgi:hypothetical protein
MMFKQKEFCFWFSEEVRVIHPVVSGSIVGRREKEQSGTQMWKEQEQVVQSE